MKYELREYSFGETLGKGFNLYFNNFLNLIIVALLLTIPEFIFHSYYPMQNAGGSPYGGSQPDFAAILIPIIFQITYVNFKYAVLSGYIIKFISNKLIAKQASAGQTFSEIVPMIPRIILLSIAIAIITGIGTMLCIIPGIILAMGLALACAILVVENLGIEASMRRSWELTKGFKAHIFALTFIVGMIAWVIVFPLSMISLKVNIDPRLHSMINDLAGAFISPIQSCVLVIMYFNLKIRKEGFGLEHLTKQFSETKGT